MTMLSRTISEQYLDRLRCTLGRLERSGDSSGPWIAEFKRNLLKRIAELGRPDPVSVAKNDYWCLTEPLWASKGPDENQTFREVVLLSGTLAKFGRIANCIVRATKVPTPSLLDGEYLDPDVVLAPPDLASAFMSFSSRAAECGSETMLDDGRRRFAASTPQFQSQS